MKTLFRIALAAAVCAIGHASAVAQSERRDARRPVPAFHDKEMWRVSRMIGLPLYDEHRRKIGTVVELLLRADGRVRAVNIDTGTLTRPNGPVVEVPFDRLEFSELSVRSAENRDNERREGKAMTPTEARIHRIATEGDWKPNHAVLLGMSREALQALPEATSQTGR
jgi:hypothetical protein